MGGAAQINGKLHPETDNFLPCNFVIDGVIYPSAENYFQCAKATNKADRKMVLQSGPGLSAYKAGNRIMLRSDWEFVKIDEMYKGNLAKFQQNDMLRNELLNTGTHPILFPRSTFWNKWNGLILERIRAELRQNGHEDSRHAAEIRDAMNKYAQGRQQKQKCCII